MTATAPPPARDPDDDMADTPQIRALRLAVTIMGLLLVVGFLTVIARIVYLASRPATQAGVATAGTAGSPPLAPEALLDLPTDASVKGLSLAGDRLAVQYVSPRGDGIAVLDLVTGRVVSRVRVTRQPETR